MNSSGLMSIKLLRLTPDLLHLADSFRLTAINDLSDQNTLIDNVEYETCDITSRESAVVLLWCFLYPEPDQSNSSAFIMATLC